MPFAHIWRLLSISCERRDDSRHGVRQPKKVENSVANRSQHRRRRRRTSGTRIHIFHGVYVYEHTNTQLCAVMRPRKETCQCDNGLATELANINRERIELCSSFSLCMLYAWSVLHSFRYGIWLTQWWGKQRCHWCAAKSFFAFFFFFLSSFFFHFLLFFGTVIIIIIGGSTFLLLERCPALLLSSVLWSH